MSGLIADSRTMVDKARVDGQNHWFVYNEPMTVESVAQSVSNLAMKFGKYENETPMVSAVWGSCSELRLIILFCPTQSRPFGTALLIGGVDEKGPQLYVIVV